MAQEVYVVMFTREGYMNDGISWDLNIEVKQVFTSLKAARKYCENPMRYTDKFEEYFYNRFTPSWDDSGYVYTLLDDGDNSIYFSIETRALITDEPETEEFFTIEDIKETMRKLNFEVF